MLGVNLRPAVARVWAPVVRTLLRAGVTADMITVTGTVGAVASAVFLIGNGVLFWGAFAVTLFVLLDMLDGALARARGGGSVFGPCWTPPATGPPTPPSSPRWPGGSPGTATTGWWSGCR